MAVDTDKQSFWEHLDVLRVAIVKIVAVAVVFGIAAFCFKDELFAVVLAPKNADLSRIAFSTGLRHGLAVKQEVLPCSSSTLDWRSNSSST